MSQFNDRIFGVNIHPSVKNKLKAKQIFAQSSEPNESILGGNTIFTKLDALGNEKEDPSINPTTALGGRNFLNSDSRGSVADLSSRTPWVRMWTAVELYHFLQGGDVELFTRKGKKLKEVVAVGEGAISHITDFQNNQYEEVNVLTKKQVKKDLQEPLEGKVYSIGNHIYNNVSETSDPMSPIFNRGEKSIRDFTSIPKSPLSADDAFKNEMQNNEYLKPPAGITSVSSETEGEQGAIKRTTVNFIVQNFTDFENIYLRYFLRPGAFVVVDFGWDTSGIYDPYQEIVEKNVSIREAIFGDNNVMVNSKGDLDVIIGQVVDYSAKARDDGGFDCSVQIVSSNEALVDKEVSDRNRLRTKFVNELTPLLINRAATFLGKSFLRKNWNTSTGNLEESTNYANSFGKKLYGTAGASNIVNISKLSLSSGVYWQTLNEEDRSIAGSNNVYISWGFFEEELLNKDLGLKFGESFHAKFNSSQTFITYHNNLVNRQNVVASLSSDKVELKFLYPSNWNNTYFTKNAKRLGYEIPKRPEEFDTSDFVTGGVSFDSFEDGAESYADEQFDVVTLDKNAKRIPLRELFINLSVIKDAFNSTNSVNDAIKQILDVINEDSFNVFNLKLTSATRDFSTLAVVDTNRVSKRDDDGEDLFQHMFVFNPYSPNSIVKSMDLSYSTPKGNVQNMIAIQNTDIGIPLFANSELEYANQALRDILTSTNRDRGIGMRYLPELDGGDFEEKDGSYETVYEEGAGGIIRDTGIFENNLEDDWTEHYKQLLTQEQELQLSEDGTLSDMVEDLGDNEIDVKKDAIYITDEELNKEEESIEPNKIYAKDIGEYFGFKCKKDFIEPKVPTTLPISLTLTTYGISSLMPGDIFTVDYLPKLYRDNVFFQIIQVKHDISPETWSTTLETVMKPRPAKKKQDLYKKSKILLSPSYFDNFISSKAAQIFTDFDLTDVNTGNVLVIKCTGKRGGRFEWYDDGNNFDTSLRQSFGFFQNYWTRSTTEGLAYEIGGLFNLRKSLYDDFRDLEIKPGQTYYLLTFMGGCIPLTYENQDDYRNTGSPRLVEKEKYVDAISEAISLYQTSKSDLNAIAEEQRRANLQ